MGGRAGRLTPSEARQAAAVGLPATRPIRAGAHQDEIIEIHETHLSSQLQSTSVGVQGLQYQAHHIERCWADRSPLAAPSPASGPDGSLRRDQPRPFHGTARATLGCPSTVVHLVRPSFTAIDGHMAFIGPRRDGSDRGEIEASSAPMAARKLRRLPFAHA